MKINLVTTLLLPTCLLVGSLQAEPPVQPTQTQAVAKPDLLESLNDKYVEEFRKNNPEAKPYSMIPLDSGADYCHYKFTFIEPHSTKKGVIDLDYKKKDGAWSLAKASVNNKKEADSKARP